MWCSVPFCPMPCHKSIGRGDLGDEVHGMQGDTTKLLSDSDGWPERGALWNSRKTHVTPWCVLLLLPLQPCIFIALQGGNGDVGEIAKSLNDAGVLTMSTLVSCVPRASNHFFLLVVVSLFTGTG